MANIERILIVGGGIAGLTLAAALHQQGFQAELTERSPAWDAVGAGIVLQPNGLRILRALHMDVAVQQAGAVVRRWGYFDQQGTRLCDTDLERLWGVADPYIGIERTKLQQVLVTGAAAIPCRLDLAIAALNEDANRVSVVFSDGSADRYDLVIGADGIASTVRQARLSAAPPVYTGVMVWRSLVPARPGGLANIQIFLGDKKSFGLVPMGDDRTYGFGMVDSPRFHDSVEGRLERLRQHFADFASPVAEYLGCLESDTQLYCSPIELVELEHWHTGRVLLIGDAAHANPPAMAQGGNMAMEDAYVLAEVLRSADSVESALEGYVARRRARATWVQRRSRAVIERMLQPPTLRNVAFREQGDQMMHENFTPLIPAP
jgi:2-polyprenyl-6-methoxyphenol hydroxylase-like FAD-dependent oxidoreductase